MAFPFSFGNYGMDPEMAMGDAATYQAMAKMGQSLPRLNPERYADNYLQRSAIRQAFQGPGVRPRAMARPRSGAGQLAQMFSGGGGFPSDNPDVSQLNSMLTPYGLSEGHINPFLFFKDQNEDGSPTWAGNHPKVAKAIEGAMLGAANTQGGSTIGENISNVARSVMSIPGIYRQNQMSQLQAPFDQAAMIQKMQDDQASRELKLAQAFHLRATGAAAVDKPTKNFSGALYTSPSTGQVLGYNQVDNSMEPVTGQPQSDIQKIGGPPKQPGAVAYPKGVTTVGEKAAWNEYHQQGWDDKAQGDPRNDKNWNNRVMYWQGRNAGVTGGAGAGARNAANQASGALSQTDQARINDLKAQRDEASRRYNESDKLTPSSVLSRKEGSTRERLAAERQERKDALDKAEQNLQNALNSAGQGVTPGGTRVQPGGRKRPKVTIDGTKVVIE